MIKRFSLSAISIALFSLFLTVFALAQLPTKRNHEVPLDSAKKFIANLEKDAVQMKVKGGMFFREAFDKILGQKGCVGIRYYYAKTDDGTPTLVIVGVDSNGKDMSTSVCEMTYPCPPYCDFETQLNK